MHTTAHTRSARRARPDSARHPWRVAVAALAAATLLAGCASTPPPTDKLALAESAVQRAERAGAQQAAPGELNAARDKLARAQSSAEGEAEMAARLAEQAEADATLAEARAEAVRAQNALATVEQSLQALREEAARSSPTASPGSGATPLPPAAATPPSTTGIPPQQP